MLNNKPYRRPDPARDIPSHQGPLPKVQPKPIRVIDGLVEGVRLADEGIAKVSVGKSEWLAKARQAVVDHAKKHGQVTSDDLHDICPLPVGAHPNLIGAVWRNLNLTFAGYQQSKRPSAHGRVIRVWAPIKDSP